MPVTEIWHLMACRNDDLCAAPDKDLNSPRTIPLRLASIRPAPAWLVSSVARAARRKGSAAIRPLSKRLILSRTKRCWMLGVRARRHSSRAIG